MIKLDVQVHGMKGILMRLGMWSDNSGKAISKALNRSAQNLRATWIRGIQSQAPGGKTFKPLAPSTIAAKGSSKALIDHGDMIRSINVQAVGSGSQMVYFVGIHRNVVRKDGTSMANLAEIHETGSLTVKDRPPARPHMAPSWSMWRRTAEELFAKDVATTLKLQGGSVTASINSSAVGD